MVSVMTHSEQGSKREWAWEQAKPASDSPRSAGALFDRQVGAEEDQRQQESKLRAAASLAREGGDDADAAEALHRLALQLEAMGALDQAEAALAEACDRVGGLDEHEPGRLAALNDHGVLLSRLGREEKAATRYGEVRDLAGDGDRPELISAQLNLGLLELAEGERTGALDLWDRAFRLARETDDAARSAQVLNAVGVLHLLEGECDEAMQLFNRGVLLAQRGGDLRGLAFTYNNISLFFSGPSMGHHIAAIPFAEMALALLSGPVDLLARLYVLNNNILIYENAHLEPARRFRAQLADALKSFSWRYPQRADDLERAPYVRATSAEPGEKDGDDEWQIASDPALLRALSRCGCDA
jgi:tetratricopeptide (TPR) repeat protein